MILFARTGSFLKVVQPQLDAGKDVIIVGHGAMDSNACVRCKIFRWKNSGTQALRTVN